MQEIGIFVGIGNEVEHAGVKIMSSRFRQLGYTVHLLDFKNIDNMLEQLGNIYNNDMLFYLGVNGLGTNIPLKNGKYLFEMLNTMYISLLTDAPYNPYTSLMQYPCNNQAVIYLDKSHRETLDYMYKSKQFSGTMFMPWGGYSDLSFEEVFAKKREIDVIYSAGFFISLPKRVWREYTIDSYLIKLLDEIADYLEVQPETVHNGARKILYQHGIEDALLTGKIAVFYKDLFLYIKTYRRIKSLEFLVNNDIVVDVYGDGWEQAWFADKLRRHGKVSYLTMAADFAKAKLVYQDMAEFNHGGHDRVFTAMLNGAVVVSEYSSYLAEEFAVNKDIFLYDWQNGRQQTQIINTLLADEPRRLAAAISAYGKAAEQHRWENRADDILKFAAMCMKSN